MRFAPVACLLFVSATLVAAAACGGSGGAASSGATVTTTVTETATDTGGSTAGSTGSEAPCGPSDFLSVLKPAMDSTAGDLTIVKVKVTRCQNDYAFVLAIPDNSGCQSGGSCYDSAQVLLSWDGTRWNVLNTGTDIGCTSVPLPDQTLVACKALGYPILTSTGFQMPSRNIACLLTNATTLRCDIRSGLQPPPATSCAGDWTSVRIGAKGPAKPLCVSDTVYDQSAPTLAYGSVWGGGGITCLSDQSGLQCSTMPGTHSFFLSRQSWSAS
ncbi:MAG TPA: DUF6636 domain-containing protein [Gaiellales bacterium]|jgi:hypothetical protein|nr:DUF6636 domain-containing protein [Gaiellales bacterium]